MRKPLGVTLLISTLALMAGLTPGVDRVLAAPARATAAISGRVFAADGSGLARARVVAYALPGLRSGCMTSPDEWREMASTTSRTGGEFVVSGLAPGSYRIGVVPPDLRVNSFGYRLASGYPDATGDGANVTSWVGYADDVVAPSAGNDVHLAVPATITGSITDQATGAGLGGVEVRAVSTAQWQRQYPAATTDATGAYSIAGLPIGAPDPDPAADGNQAQRYGPVLVDTTGWHGVWLWWFDSVYGGPDTTVDLTDDAPDAYDKALPRGSRVVLDVVDPNGRPVAGLATRLDTAFPYPPVRTNAKGRAILGQVPEPGMPLVVRVNAFDVLGRYRTTWYPQAPAWELAQQFTLPGEGSELHLRMTVRKDAATVTGLVGFATGDPAPPAIGVNAVLFPGGVQSWDWVMSGTSTHCDGSFDLHGLWPGTAAQILLSSPWDEAIEGSAITPAPGPNFVGLQRLPAWVVSGVVSDQNGQRLADIDVDLWTRDASNTWFRVTDDVPYAHGTTDEWGQYRVFLPYEPWDGMKVSFTDPAGGYVAEFYDDVATPELALAVVDQDPWNNWGYQAYASLAPSP